MKGHARSSMENRYERREKGTEKKRRGKESRVSDGVRGRGRSWALFNLSRSVDRAESSASWIGG